MKQARFHVVFVGVLATLALAATVGIASSAESLDPTREVLVSSAQAVEIVEKFAGSGVNTGDLAVGAPIDGLVDSFYEIRGQSISAAVDVNDGRVVSLLLRDRVPTRSTLSVKEADAKLAAEQFLDERRISRADLEAQVMLVNHGDTNEYAITWQRYEGGVRVPDSRTVGVDAATGSVFRYVDTLRKYAPPSPPKVDRDSAISAAMKSSSLDGDATVDDVGLVITFDQNGAQRLVWQIALSASTQVSPGGSQSYLSHVLVEVDAISGAAVVLAKG